MFSHNGGGDDHGTRRDDRTQAHARWQHLVASHEATAYTLHRAMYLALYLPVGMVVTIAINSVPFYYIVNNNWINYTVTYCDSSSAHFVSTLSLVGLDPTIAFQQKHLTFYWCVLANVLWIPWGLSQYTRCKSPVEAASWSLVTRRALMGIGNGLLGGFQTRPIDFFIFVWDVNTSFNGGYNLLPLS